MPAHQSALLGTCQHVDELSMHGLAAVLARALVFRHASLLLSWQMEAWRGLEVWISRLSTQCRDDPGNWISSEISTQRPQHANHHQPTSKHVSFTVSTRIKPSRFQMSIDSSCSHICCMNPCSAQIYAQPVTHNLQTNHKETLWHLYTDVPAGSLNPPRSKQFNPVRLLQKRACGPCRRMRARFRCTRRAPWPCAWLPL